MVDQSINLHSEIPRISVIYLYTENLQDFHRRACKNGLDVPRTSVQAEAAYGAVQLGY
jgi:hypothetical protein